MLAVPHPLLHFPDLFDSMLIAFAGLFVVLETVRLALAVHKRRKVRP